MFVRNINNKCSLDMLHYILHNPNIDASSFDNYALKKSIENREYSHVELLLGDQRVSAKGIDIDDHTRNLTIKLSSNKINSDYYETYCQII